MLLVMQANRRLACWAASAHWRLGSSFSSTKISRLSSQHFVPTLNRTPPFCSSACLPSPFWLSIQIKPKIKIVNVCFLLPPKKAETRTEAGCTSAVQHMGQALTCDPLTPTPPCRTWLQVLAAEIELQFTNDKNQVCGYCTYRDHEELLLENRHSSPALDCSGNCFSQAVLGSAGKNIYFFLTEALAWPRSGLRATVCATRIRSGLQLNKGLLLPLS